MANRMIFVVALIFSTIICSLVDAGTPWIPQKRNETLKRHEQLVNQTHHYATKIHGIFLGDSITEGWLYNGKAVWSQHYQTRNVFNYGIGGDRTEHVLWRIENGEFDGIPNCHVIVLMIGTNNIGNNQPADIAKGVAAILKETQTKMPKAKTLLLSVFPRGGPPDKDVQQVNSFIGKFHDGHRVFYMDVTKHFQKEPGSGEVFEQLYVKDKLHLSEKGYETWYKAIEAEFSKLLKH